ncbi:MAG: 3-dehydroquinate synthase [Akkermansiaceae bacterium]|nr:3-dehydroquinate synthase [Akkermansiaceae bacterium]
MARQDFQIPVSFTHRIIYTRDAFSEENRELADILAEGGGRRALVIMESPVAHAWPDITPEIAYYFDAIDVELSGIYTLPGGEAVKSDDLWVRETWQAIDKAHLDRHSYLIAIGGGAFLDAIGYGAATAHRGVRLVRFPTTTLSQDDSGVGVKCAINAFGKKNWIGSFAVPFAVINDFRFLHTQPEDSRRAGLIEAVKVALVKDGGFYEWIESKVDELHALQPEAVETCVERSGILHAKHIATSGDPFETGSSRPLDYGHWAAHKLEALTDYRLSHADAVAIGIALDTLYAAKADICDPSLAERVLAVIQALGLPIHHPGLNWTDEGGERRVFEGIHEFREHLGGELTVLMLADIGKGVDVHDIDLEIMAECIEELGKRAGNA